MNKRQKSDQKKYQRRNTCTLLNNKFACVLSFKTEEVGHKIENFKDI